MATESIPESADELTCEWLNLATGWQVETSEFEMLGRGQGFLGDIMRLHLQSDAPGTPTSVIAKLPKRANRVVGELLGIYEREIMFYQDLAASVPVRTPEIFVSKFDRDAGSEKQKQILKVCDSLPKFMTPLIGSLANRVAASKNRRYLLIMEDLGALECGDQLMGAEPDACALVLKQISAMHRLFWNSPGLSEKFWLLPLDIDARMRHGMFCLGLPTFRNIATPALTPYPNWLEEYGASLMTAFVRDAPNTLIHCDLRLDNVCFDTNGCVFLDWQLTRTGPAAYDVAYFLGGALAPEVSESRERELVREYHRALDPENYPFEDLWRDYQRGLLLAATVLAPSEDLEIDEGRGQEMMSRWLERLSARLQNVDPDLLL